jgi:hypothetical protein
VFPLRPNEASGDEGQRNVLVISGRALKTAIARQFMALIDAIEAFEWQQPVALAMIARTTQFPVVCLAWKRLF